MSAFPYLAQGNEATVANHDDSAADAPYTDRMRKRPRIAIDRIRAVARPDQLADTSVMPLVLASEHEELAFNLEDDPILHPTMNMHPQECAMQNIAHMREATGDSTASKSPVANVSEPQQRHTKSAGLAGSSSERESEVNSNSVGKSGSKETQAESSTSKTMGCNNDQCVPGPQSTDTDAILDHAGMMYKTERKSTTSEPSLVDEEVLLLNTIEDDITCVEEKELLHRIDDDITLVEEEEILKKIGEEIQQKAAPTCRKWGKGCLVEFESIPNKPEETILCSKVNWQQADLNYSNLLAERKDSASMLKASDKSRRGGSLVENLEERQLIVAKKTIPKLLPGSKKPFITAESFQVEVVEPFKQLHLQKGTFMPELLWGFNVSIESSRSVPDSMQLKTTGTVSAVELFRKPLNTYLKEKVLKHRLEKLLLDPFNLEIDLELETARAITDILDIKLLKHPYGKVQGLLLDGISSRNEITRVLGQRAAPAAKALLRINGNVCYDADEVKHLVCKQTAPTTIVTLCVDRFADLSQLKLSARGNIWFRNGRPCLVEDLVRLRECKNGLAKKDSNVVPNMSPSPRGRRNMVSSDKVARLIAHTSLPSPPLHPTVASSSAVTTMRKAASHGLQGAWEDNSTNTIKPVVAAIQPAKPNKAQNYSDFEAKYRKVREIEYSKTEMQSTFAAGQMWRQHQEKFGPVCDDNCMCPFDLDYLTNTVVKNFVDKQVKKNKLVHTSWRRGQSPVGFVDCFVPKFLPLLKKEFPTEKPFQLLQRAVDMWPHHLRQRNFGTECRKSCQCMEGWTLVFNRGKRRTESRPDPAKKRKVSADSTRAYDPDAIPRKNLADATKNSSLIQQSALASNSEAQNTRERSQHAKRTEDMTSIPRKKQKDDSRSDSPIVRKISVDTSQSDVRSHLGTGDRGIATIPRKRQKDVSKHDSPIHRTTLVDRDSNFPHGVGDFSSLEPPLKRKKSSEMHNSQQARAELGKVRSQMQKYAVTYRCSEPLGIFCVTERKKGSQSSCKVHSVCPEGQTKDPRVQKGSCILTVEVLIRGTPQLKVSIHDHNELKSQYEIAKTTGSELRLWLINSDVKQSASSKASREWNSEGLCRIKSPQGWAGGAEIIDATLNPPTAQKHTENSKLGNVLHQSKSGKGSDLQPDAKQTEENTQQLEAVEVKEAVHRETASLVPIYRDRGKKEKSAISRSKSVRFAAKESFGKRFFFKECPSTEQFQSSSDTSTTEATSRSVSHSSPLCEGNDCSIDNLVAAVRKGTCDDVIRLLGTTEELSFDLDSELLFLKKELAGLSEQIQAGVSDSHIENVRKELGSKIRVLKIYINVRAVVDNARYMKHWVRHEVKVVEIRNLQLSDFGRIHHINEFIGRVSTITRASGQISAHEAPLGDLPPTYISKSGFVSYDTSLPHYSLNHCQGLSLEERELRINFIARHSSSPESVLGRLTVKFDEFVRATEKQPNGFLEIDIPTGNLLQSGRAIISVHRAPIKKDYVTEKIKKQVDAISSILEWIKTFNDDLANSGRARYERLTGHLRGNDNVSLLHAAILLRQTEAVKQLINLGADPRAKSVLGSAMEMAMNLVDRTAEKAYSRNEAAYQGLLDCYKTMVRYMKTGKDDLVEDGGPGVESTIQRTIQDNFHNQRLEYPRNEEAHARGLSNCNLGNTPLQQDIHCRDHRSLEQKGNSLGRPSNHEGSSRVNQEKGSGTEQWSNPHGFQYAHLAGRGENQYLPRMKTKYWFTSTKAVPCRFFGSTTCTRGRNCSFLHIEPPLGKALDRYYEDQSIDVDNRSMHFAEKLDARGRKWFTACYRDMNQNIFYYAEGGHDCEVNEQDIFWYPSKQKAEDALKRVMKAAKYRRTKQSVLKQSHSDVSKYMNPSRRFSG